MKKNLFLIAVATAVITSCSSDVEETIVAEKCPVRLSSKSLTGMTRAGQSVQLTQFDNGQQVGIFLAEDNGSGTAVTTGTNVTAYDQPLTYVSNGSGGLTNTQYWPQDGNGLHIFGVYPLAAATTAASYSATDVSFSVQADQTTDANYMLSDLMTGLPTDGNPVVRTTSAVPLTFTHLLTKINVNLTAGDGFTQAEIDDAVVSILGTKLTTTFDVQGKTVGSASGDATAIAAGTGAATSAIIVPQTLAAGASFIQVAVGGGNYIYKLDAATTFAAKNRYTFNLTVNKTGLVLTVTNITPWTAVDPIEGSAEMLIPKTKLSTITSNYTAKNGEILTGTLGSNVKVSIANNATVTLDGVTIDGTNHEDYQWAGINCLGNATIILGAGTTNTVKGFYRNYPGIHVPEGSTLTIKGTGTLNVSSNSLGAGIGGGYNISCGNIVIEGGNITAIVGEISSGIGSGYQASCGDITISGGNITTTTVNNYYDNSAGIGSGYYKSSCGDITISGGIINATGSRNGAGIGSGHDSSCGDITISGGNVTANGREADAAGIGNSVGSSTCGVITISGGTVNATGVGTGAGIGSAHGASCDDIIISGGTVTAKGGPLQAGIGSGNGTSCKNVTILSTVTKVTAEKGSSGYLSIGKGSQWSCTCGTVTIGGTIYWQDNAAVNGGDTYLATSPFIYEP